MFSEIFFLVLASLAIIFICLIALIGWVIPKFRETLRILRKHYPWIERFYQKFKK